MRRTLIFKVGKLSSGAAASLDGGRGSKRSRETAHESGRPTHHAGEDRPRGSRVAARRQRAATTMHRRRLGGHAETLKRLSGSATSAASYHKHAKVFTQWAARQRLRLLPSAKLDDSFCKYLEHLFTEGHNLHVARMAIWGYGFVKDQPVDKATLPRTHRALKGFARAVPATEKDPMP